jgi:hypothetical protein
LCKVQKKFTSEDLKTLQIEYSPLEKASTIRELDIYEKYLKPEIFKNVDFIKDSIENMSNLNEALSKMRLITEEILKWKYYDKMPILIKDSTKSTSSYIDELTDNLKIWDATKRQEAKDLDLHFEHHAQISKSLMEMQDMEKVKHLKRFLDFIPKI